MGSFAVERFGTERLQSLTREEIDERFKVFRISRTWTEEKGISRSCAALLESHAAVCVPAARVRTQRAAPEHR